MEHDELATPPTQIEIAELLYAARKPDMVLSECDVSVIRRLAFQYDLLTERVRIMAELLAKIR